MSKLLRFIGRAAIAPVFIVGGKNALDNSEQLSGVVEQAADKLGIKELPVSSNLLVQANGVSMMGLGTALGLGIFPRLAALGLVGSLVPTTYAGHRFWEESEPEKKNTQVLSFALNTAIVGGLLNIAAAPRTKHKEVSKKESRRARKAEKKAARADRKAKIESAKSSGLQKVGRTGGKLAFLTKCHSKCHSK